MTDDHIDSEEWRWVIISSGLLIILILLPYLWAYAAAGSGERFMGMLIQPIDGGSYLAKMQQGADGSWVFRLPFTPEAHRPVFLFTFYILLGHLANWLALSLALVFHTARLVGSLFMLLMLYIFIADWTANIQQRRITWGLVAVGGGFGWIVLLAAEHPTPELTIPEAYPLYASFANAHFPWAIALILYVAHALSRSLLSEDRPYPAIEPNTVGLVVATLAIMAMLPIALFPLGFGIGALLLSRWLEQRQFPRREFAWAAVVLVPALPFLFYALWAVSSANPVFDAWNAQNQTPSPPPWEYLVGFGPLLLLAAPAIWKTWHTRNSGIREGEIILLGWLVANILLLYAPFSLQRRFSIGLILPLAIYAGRGLSRVILFSVRRRWRPLVVSGTFILIAPSTVLALAVPSQGILTFDELFYVNKDEAAMLDWLDEHTSSEEVVLASPTFSLFVPGTSGARVVYGHPFETVRAEERESAVLDFYRGEDCNLMDAEGVGYVIFGPRERQLGGGCMPESEPVYDSGDIRVYQVDG